MPTRALPILRERVVRSILLIRGQRVMLDADLAALYDVPTKVLIQSVKRNQARFPDDFMFRLTASETERLRSQIVTSNVGRGGRRYVPYAFTEQGVAMLSSVLRSPRAVQVNVTIMRTFVRLRRWLGAIRELMMPSQTTHRAIGFRPRHAPPSRRTAKSLRTSRARSL